MSDCLINSHQAFTANCSWSQRQPKSFWSLQSVIDLTSQWPSHSPQVPNGNSASVRSSEQCARLLEFPHRRVSERSPHIIGNAQLHGHPDSHGPVDCFTLLLARHLVDVSCYIGPSMPSGIYGNPYRNHAETEEERNHPIVRELLGKPTSIYRLTNHISA